jgi:hypothetical protein
MAYWPIATIGKRRPEISHEWEGPKHEGGPPVHEGLDIMFRREDAHGWEIPQIPGGVWARAVVAGTVLYARAAPNGLRVRIRDQHGQDHLYLHLGSLAVHPGDFVAAKTRLGLVAYDPSPADPSHTWHLHYGLWMKNAPGPKDGRGYAAVDPTEFAKSWAYD